MLRIRLKRTGSTHNAHYRVVVIESSKARDAKAVEEIGHYHPTYPKDSKDRIVLNTELFTKWVKFGAMPSDTVVDLALKVGINEAAKFKKNHVKGQNYGKSKKEIKGAA